MRNQQQRPIPPKRRDQGGWGGGPGQRDSSGGSDGVMTGQALAGRGPGVELKAWTEWGRARAGGAQRAAFLPRLPSCHPGVLLGLCPCGVSPLRVPTQAPAFPSCSDAEMLGLLAVSCVLGPGGVGGETALLPLE